MIEAEARPLRGNDLCGARGLLSVDVDYFTSYSTTTRAAAMLEIVRAAVLRGVPLGYDEHHARMAEVEGFPFDVVVNVDYHMDCRQDYLFGAAPKTPPCDATVFEDLLTTAAIGRYVWVLPTERRPQVARLYAMAVLMNAQPTLPRIHVLDDWRMMEELLATLSLAQIFVCRSREYGTRETDELYRSMTRLPKEHGGD